MCRFQTRHFLQWIYTPATVVASSSKKATSKVRSTMYAGHVKDKFPTNTALSGVANMPIWVSVTLWKYRMAQVGTTTLKCKPSKIPKMYGPKLTNIIQSLESPTLPSQIAQGSMRLTNIPFLKTAVQERFGSLRFKHKK